MIDFEIRPARADEAGTIRSMIRAERLDPLNVHWENFLVAIANERIIGIGQIKPYPGARELGSLAVAADQRKIGVGAAIIKALVARESARSSAGPLYLFCLAFREPYYGKFGFRQVTVNDLPAALKPKYALGKFFTRLFRRRLIAMYRAADAHQIDKAAVVQ
jgi:N-acetylglutamate synthase-like GNAT family acetyltransferase